MKRFVLALQFLTVITVKSDLAVGERDLARSTAWYPLVGLLLGLILVLAHLLFSRLWLPLVTDILIVVTLACLTRGLHLDGLADTLDGLLGSRDRQKSLEIMKDSRVGVFGAVGAASVLLLKFAALTSIPDFLAWQVLVAFPVASRAAMTLLAFRTPSARTGQGLGGGLAGLVGGGEVLTALFTAAVVCMGVLGGRGLIALAVVLAVSFLWRAVFLNRLGGVTGDCFGFVNESGEVLFLLTIAAFLRYYP